ncbi:hypothetical protein CVT25_015919 [Psilocybe cyanescens]|uniref:Uncharacterized protein n=1 Tax=Psilocybe cyanescens TaxID=93625 RepID=A0A409XRR8_PSICY|nr:hypothetical protein CVT25_015919 [Psilocybe cyanescens]
MDEAKKLGTTPLEPKDPDYLPNFFDIQRAFKQPWEYLVNRRLSSEEICLACRGKCLAIGVGYDKAKEAKMCFFVTPTEFIEPGSSSKAKRTINVFAAIVMDTFAVVFSNFARLICMHVISKDSHWTLADLEVGSPEWPLIWTVFPDGPDWTLEYDTALIALDYWCIDICKYASGYSKPIVYVIEENSTQVHLACGSAPIITILRDSSNAFRKAAVNMPQDLYICICKRDCLIPPIPLKHFSDLTEAGYATTIGPAQFFEAKKNKIDPDHAMKVCIWLDGPAKISSGGHGRKHNTSTQRSLETIISIKRQ